MTTPSRRSRPSRRAALAALAAPLLLALILPGPARALDIPLPDLAGGYEYDPAVAPNPGDPQVRTATFTIPDGVTSIDQLEVVVSGAWTTGEITCWDGGPPVAEPFLSPLGVALFSDAFGGGFFGAVVEVADGAFASHAATFEPCCGPDAPSLDDLLGHEIAVQVFYEWAILGICALTLDPVGTIDEIHLELTGTVAVQPDRWSRVKALYR